MGARQKLNQAYLTGSVLVAGIAGWLMQSWMVFIFALLVLVGLSLYAGEIRMRRRE